MWYFSIMDDNASTSPGALIFHFCGGWVIQLKKNSNGYLPQVSLVLLKKITEWKLAKFNTFNQLQVSSVVSMTQHLSNLGYSKLEYSPRFRSIWTVYFQKICQTLEVCQHQVHRVRFGAWFLVRNYDQPMGMVSNLLWSSRQYILQQSRKNPTEAGWLVGFFQSFGMGIWQPLGPRD